MVIKKEKIKMSKPKPLTKEQILPIAELFYINNYVNGYSFNQLMLGDFAAFEKQHRLV